jgi:hypothetical protein
LFSLSCLLNQSLRKCEETMTHCSSPQLFSSFKIACWVLGLTTLCLAEAVISNPAQAEVIAPKPQVTTLAEVEATRYPAAALEARTAVTVVTAVKPAAVETVAKASTPAPAPAIQIKVTPTVYRDTQWQQWQQLYVQWDNLYGCGCR